MATREDRERELTRIYQRDGHVKASVVVQEATPKKSPLHNDFEWDDKKAAHAHRLDTARRIIRITPIRSEGDIQPQQLVHVRPLSIDGPTAVENEREGYYKPVHIVARNDSEYERAMDELMQQMRAIERSVNVLRKAAGHEVQLLPQLTDALKLAKETLLLMRTGA